MTEPVLEAPPVEIPSDYNGDGSGMMRAFNERKAAEAAASASQDTPPPEPPAEQEVPAAQPEVEKPVEEPTAEPAKRGDKAKETWATLKQAASEGEKHKAALTEREKELSGLRDQLKDWDLTKKERDDLKSEIERVKKDNEAYEKRTALYDIKESKEYHEAVLKPTAEIGKTLRELSVGYQVPEADIHNAFYIPERVERGRALEVVMDGWLQEDKNEVYNASKDYWKIVKTAEEMETNAHATKQELEYRRQQDEQEEKKRSTMAVEAAQDATKRQMVEKISLLKDPKIAEYVFSAPVDSKDPSETVYNAYAGRALVKMTEAYAGLEQKLAALQKEFDKRSAVAPRAGGDGAGGSVTTGNPEEKITGETSMERFRQRQQLGLV